MNEYDQGVAMNFGPVIEQLPSRNILNRTVAYIFVGLNFYRRLLFPFIIVMTGTSSALSLIIALQTNLFYNAFVLSQSLYHDSMMLRTDFLNEVLIIASTYIFLLFAEDYIFELDTRN